MKLSIFFCVLLHFLHSQAVRPPKWDPLEGTILVNRPPVPKQDERFRRQVSVEEEAEPAIGEPLDRIARSLQPQRPGPYKPSPTFPRPDDMILINRPTMPIRFRREAEPKEEVENIQPGQDTEDEQHTRERRWSGNNGGAGQQGDRGSWGVAVNKDKGRGPQVRTEAQGNIYTSPKGNVRVDAGGHHEFGKGRKPDYGGQVRVEGRFRREAAEEEMEEEGELERTKRWAPNGGGGGFNPSAGQQNKGGSWGVSVNKDKGSGPQVRTEAQGNVYSSPKGNVKVDAGGHHEFGKGRKPDYGGHVKVGGRWRREAEEESDFEAVKEPNVEAVEETRVRRQAQNDKRGSVSVTANRDKGRGPQIRTDAQYKAWQSKNGNWQVTGQGYHEAGRGRKPSYGGGVTVTGRFRREAEEESDFEAVEEPNVEAVEETRVRRQAQNDKRGSVSMSVNHDRGSGPQIRTDAQYRAWQSRNGNWQLSGQGFHEAGRGRKPSYGGGVTLTGRF